MAPDENRPQARPTAVQEISGSTPVVLGNARVARSEPRPLIRDAYQILGTAGFVLLTVSWTHLINTFFPYRFGIATWEYAAVTQSIDVMPLGIAGLAMAGSASVANGWRRRGLALVVMCVINVLILFAMVGLIVLDLPIAWNTVPDAMHRDLIKSSAKAVGFAALFVWFHIWVARLLLRARRSAPA
jgi:hypothetical protein